MISPKEQAQAIMMNRLNNGKIELQSVELTFQKLSKKKMFVNEDDRELDLNAEQEDFMIESQLEMIRENRENREENL